MNQPNDITAFAQELVQRLFTKSPKFFRVFQLFSGLLVLITGVPQFLSMFNINLPDLWSEHVNAAVAWASRATLFVSFLTTQSKATAVTEDGQILKKTDSAALPYTAKKELKAANKADDIPTVVSTPIDQSPKP